MARKKRPRPTGPSPAKPARPAVPDDATAPAAAPTDKGVPSPSQREEGAAPPADTAVPSDDGAAEEPRAAEVGAEPATDGPGETSPAVADEPAAAAESQMAHDEPSGPGPELAPRSAPAEPPSPPVDDAAVADEPAGAPAEALSPPADDAAVADEPGDRSEPTPPPRRARAPRSRQGRGSRAPAARADDAGPRADDAGPRADALPGAAPDDASAEKVAAAPAPRPGAEAPASEPAEPTEVAEVAEPAEPASTPPPQVAGGGRVDALADAILTVARAEGQLIAVADELFQLARALEASDELLDALADAHIPAPRRQQVVDELLHGRALPLTAAMVTMVVGAGRGRELPRVADALVAKVAAVDNRAVAIVRSAIALDEGQRGRLTEALHQTTGRAVEVRVVIDPTVLGGLVTTVGDMVIDGSVRTRLDKLRTTL